MAAMEVVATEATMMVMATADNAMGTKVSQQSYCGEGNDSCGNENGSRYDFVFGVVWS